MIVGEDPWTGSFTCRFGNGLLLVEAAGDASTHDGYDGLAPVHRSGDSLYVSVRHGSDGPVRVDVVLGGPPAPGPGLTVRFDGVLNVPSRAVRLCSIPDEVMRTEVTVPAPAVRVRIHTDDAAEAARVLVALT